MKQLWVGTSTSNPTAMSFSHRDQSTPENAWVQAGALDLPIIPDDAIAKHRSIIVLAAHPDDEALGAASLLARAGEWNCQVTILLFTAGENSHPYSRTHSPQQLGQSRLREFELALATLGGELSSRFLALPDGALPEFRDQIVDEIMREVARSGGPVTLVAPYSQDGHGDYEVVGAAALEAGRRSRTVVLEYPIWFWHWADPTDPRWRSWRFLPDPVCFDRQALFACYQSQIASLSDRPGDEAVLGTSHLKHFDRGGDTFAISDFRPRTATKADKSAFEERRHVYDAHTASAVFDGVHEARADPWAVWNSEYELAKRENLLGHLPSHSFDHILEIGCSIGTLSHDLADCSTKVTAIDASREALKKAKRLRLRASAKIDFVYATVPFDWPGGRFDCVVLSETGFYLTRSQLLHTMERIDESTPSRFVLVLCHWKGEISDWPLDADEVHDTCLRFWPRKELEFHTDAGSYRLDIVTVEKKTDPDSARGLG